MLLILWDSECCDAAAGQGSVLVLVGGEEGRPLGGRLAPTPCPDRSSDDDRSPRLSERRSPICLDRPAPPVSSPAAGALRSLVARPCVPGQDVWHGIMVGQFLGRRGPRTRTLERCQVRATQAPNSLVSSWINAGYGELGLFGSPVARKFPLPAIVVAVVLFLGAACPLEKVPCNPVERSVASCQAGWPTAPEQAITH